MINEGLTDLDRVELTKLSYEAMNVGERVVVAGKKIGQLTRDVYAKDGMQAFLSKTTMRLQSCSRALMALRRATRQPAGRVAEHQLSGHAD